AANGLGLIGIMVHPVQGVPDFGMASDTPMRRETRQRCRDLGIAIELIEGFLLTPETDVAGFRGSLESGAWLEARSVNIILRDPDLARLAHNLAAACELAGEYGIAAGTEWSRRTPLKSPAEAAAFLGANAPGCKLQFDSLHLYRAGFSAADIAALDPRIVGRGQLSDGPAEMPVERQFEEALGGRMFPGDGTLPLDDFVRALPAGTVIGIEVPTTALKDQGVSAAERVARAVAGTRTVLAKA
ncbi:MAG TPA: TIM barrel protein, partial [Alphaproteobacteria bacterium]|nr:TIM barrel protein [Alphaproteobacteria bacterium]